MDTRALNTALTGSTSRVVHISPTGGAIFRLLPTGKAKSVRVVASSRVLPVVPKIGESLTLSGQYENHRIWGYQFVADAITRALPRDGHVVTFLRSHPSFAWLGRTLALRLWKKLGPLLTDVLTSGNYITIADVTGISRGDAMRLVEVWRDYSLQVAVSEQFILRGLPIVSVERAIELWGGAAVRVVASNPYALVPIASWVEIDKACTSHLDIARDDDRRLTAACLSSVEEFLARKRVIRMEVSKLTELLQTRLGDRSLAASSISLAGLRGIVKLEDGGTVQPTGIHILEQAFNARLNRWVTEGNATVAKRLAKDGLDANATERRTPGFGLLSVCPNCLESVFSSVQALHIFPSASLRKQGNLAAGATALFSEVIGSEWRADADTTEYYIHGGEMFDLPKATMLVYALPKTCKVTIVFAAGVDGPQHSFWQTLLSTWAPLQRSLDSTIVCKMSLPTQRNAGADTAVPGATAIDSWRPPEASAVVQSCAGGAQEHHVKLPDWEAVQDQALATYREAVDSDTALILTRLKKDASRLNRLLHLEHVDLRIAQGFKNAFITIYGGEMATIDEPIVARSDIHEKKIFAGSSGKITNIAQLPNVDGLANLEPNLVVASGLFDTVGHVNLTSAECAKFELAYATTISLDRWGAVAHRIVIAQGRLEATSPLLFPPLMRTNKSFHIIEEETILSCKPGHTANKAIE